MGRLGFFLSFLPGPTVSRMPGTYTVLRIPVLSLPKCSHYWTSSSSETTSALSTYPFSHMPWKGCLSYVSCSKPCINTKLGWIPALPNLIYATCNKIAARCLYSEWADIKSLSQKAEVWNDFLSVSSHLWSSEGKSR